VARGGIRFSDRHDDFRTEILGLMKTQMVKNAVIVPAGSKGGFIVKRFAVAEDRAAEIRECYSTLIRGLLDLTDDIEDGEIVPPSGVVRHDDDDPYLVVAADKGTASFSDLANSIAQEYGFWLDDAFASGGSHGYDHKKEGITARGAWECVRTHFRELGKNPDRDRFTAVGIGDMSGDVFGNGMLLSRTIQLRAAFNHEHVFLDPDPDPETSYRERERLFRLPRSRWTDYDRAAMSAGAMVVPRTAKAAPLTPEVRAMLGIDAPALDGEGLVRTLLRMETELLFNGGIGTYVKASAETQAEAGDSTNDPVRVNGSDVRAAVAAEGGNLGFTQRGRIEYALRGGRLNTDAIDNSGGVDLSDHEVNLKILLRPLVERGVIKFEARNALLDRVKPDVIRHVLDHNARQSWLLTVDQNRSRVRLVEFRDHMTDLEQEGLLDRLLEALPDREALRARRSAFLGFTRPELAVLAAYSKISLQRRLLASRWIDDPYLEGFLTSYFPQGIVDRFPDAVRAHRLRREIAAIELTNRVIDRMGAAYPQRMLRDTGTDPASAVVACAVVFGITDADRLWDRIVESPLRVDDAVGLCLRWEEAVEAAAKFLVGAPGGMPPMSESVERWRRPVADVADVLEDTLPVTLRNEAAEEERRLETMGLTAGVARSLTALSTLRASLEVAAIAAAAGVPLRDTTQAYQQVGTLADFATIERWIAGVSGDDRWEKRAAEALREDLSAARHEITLAALARGEATLDERLAGFAAAVESDLAKVRSLGEDLRSGRKASLAGMIVIVRELRRLAERLRT
jgi:glutamate dehydrogenase